MYGYDFRGLGKRNRAAFKEADDVANTRIPRVTGAKRGVGDGLGAKSDDDAFGDVTNAARRGEAAAPKALSGVGLEASVENNEPKDAAGASTTTTTTAVATLKFVKRADGGGIGGAPVALEIFAATLCRAITNNETVRGVDFESIISEIYLRVSPSACTRDEFVSWLTRGAPMFATTGVPNSDMDDVAMADESREFRQESSLAVWSSPLNAAESSFAWSSPLNAVRVAAKALDASDDETREALEEAETAKGVRLRYLRTRSTYHYRVSSNDGLVFAYVGESVDVERRINDHLTALIGDGRADTIQRGHALVREAAARKGEDPADSFDFRAWVLAGYDEASAVELAKTYVETCASPHQPPPSILEVARAIAGAGFFQEAVWTVYYGTLHGHTASEGVIGMNFSQPGVCHPSQGDGVDSTDDMTSWDAMKALIKSGKTTTTTTTTGSHERSKEKEFKCAVCYKEISLLTKRRFRPHGDGGGRVCAGCYNKSWRAKQPAFTCRKCCTKIAPGKRSYPHGEGGGGRMCNACGQSALRAKQQKR
mmetsp:Transcript_5573/g.18386  ORF Transcript_5573/g.18386 Transcript_5573/m.18386 type:complete len:539 (+) Transcript_5573:433-2049(+)